MREKTTKYTNIISMLFIVLAAVVFFFQLPSNQIGIPSTDFTMLYYMVSIISFSILIVIVLYFLPMIVIIKVTYNVPLPYLKSNRVEASYFLFRLNFVNIKIYQKLCVVRC